LWPNTLNKSKETNVEALVMAAEDVVVVADTEDVAVVAGVVGMAAHQPTLPIIETLTKRIRMIDRMRIRMGMEMATAPPSRV
jgi:hypothetical protein